MGNQHSSLSSPIDIERLRPFSRNVGALGLSRNELDKRCQPSGLYGACNWDDKAIRRLIADGKIAPRLKGEEYPDSSSSDTIEECPICFLSYSAVNITRCCNAIICTECYLQVRPQKEKDSTCPFCNDEHFSVTIAKKKNFSLVPGSMSSSSSLTTASSACSSNTSNTAIDVNAKKKNAASVAPHTPPTETSRFGSELEKDERFKKFKKRSESFASTSGSDTPQKDKEIIESIAITTEERQRLEEEMKAQHYHPLALKLEAEAQERRLQNDRVYRRSTNGNNSRNETAANRRLVRVRGGSTRNWDQLANFLEGEEINDITALERAIIHSMGEGDRGSGDNDNNSNDDDDSNNRNIEQQESFPLFRSLLTGQLDINHRSASADSAAAGRRLTWNRRQRRQVSGSSIGADLALDTTSLMVLSEDEQIAMAIAASMRDQEQQSAHNDNNDEDGNGNEKNDNKETADGESNDTDPNNNSEKDNSNAALTADNQDSGVGAGLVADSTLGSKQFKHQGNGDEASTITELARVVTDSCTPNVETCGITA